MSLFQDKVVLVTGGGSGLGRALCEELARRGAISVVTDICKKAAAQAADGITSAGGRAHSMELDVTQAASVTETVDRVVAEYGRLDYMFNNAGIIILGEVRDMDLEHWHRIIGVNLLGVVYGTTAAYSHMVKQGHGHIVNIASLAGLVPMPMYTAYSTTKYAVMGLSNSLRPEASRLGVKISVVCPGIINTGMAATILRMDTKLIQNRSRSQNHKNMASVAAAQAILCGVERNQSVIVFPFTARLLWWVYRIQPAFLGPLESRFVKTLRSARTESSTL